MITITNSHKRGFWRGGHHHPKGVKEWPNDTFSMEQLALIEADKRLGIEEVEGGGPDEGGKPDDTSDRRAMIFAAIQSLDPENKELFTGKGAPQVAALEAASGLSDITAEERDELWAEYQSIQAEGGK